MVPAGVSVDLRRAAKLAPGDNGNVVQKTSLVEILDQRGQAEIKQRQRSARFGETVFVPVPVVVPL